MSKTGPSRETPGVVDDLQEVYRITDTTVRNRHVGKDGTGYCPDKRVFARMARLVTSAPAIGDRKVEGGVEMEYTDAGWQVVMAKGAVDDTADSETASTVG